MTEPDIRHQVRAEAHGVQARLGVALPFPATVRGVDGEGARFTERCHLNTLSPSGLSLCLRRWLPVGTQLFVCVWLGIDDAESAPRLASYARVEGLVPHGDGCWLITLVFTRQRFLYARAAATD